MVREMQALIVQIKRAAPPGHDPGDLTESADSNMICLECLTGILIQCG